MKIGYCTNVHAGHDLETTQSNLAQHAIAVKDQFAPDGPMGIGLWLSAATAQHLLHERSIAPFSTWLQDNGLVPFTLNGFPYGNFHQPVVKHDVYLPTWEQKERADFTDDLITLLDQLLPPGEQGSISTLPLMWGDPKPTDEQFERCASNLLRIARRLRELEEQSGRLIYVCLEPEPGCALQTTDDIVSLYDRYLFRLSDQNDDVNRYLRVCHDICHAAVMFEEQQACFQRFQDHGIQVGKVQVSSAIRVDWNSLENDVQRSEALAQMSQFAEDRYLHQLSIRDEKDGSTQFVEDLPTAIEQCGERPTGEWCVHFHMPIYLEKFGQLQTTRDEINRCLSSARKLSNVEHFEVETYAWNVLPKQLQLERLADGIAKELSWFEELVSQDSN